MERTKAQAITDIKENKTSLGIEFGSTRIKAVLIDSSYAPIASGSYEWENKLENGFWTYSLDEVLEGLRKSYQEMAQNVFENYGLAITSVGTIGISAMMHGYMAFDEENQLLTPFRTWRNATTHEAAKALTEIFQFNIPERWSIAHLYQAILDKEEHVGKVAFLTTLAGYVHWQLTGEKVLGVGDASGMFPIDPQTKDYDQQMIEKFTQLPKVTPYSLDLRACLPKVLKAGENAGKLTEKGALLLDPTGRLQAGSSFCPPEGDAGTGMVATNSVAKCTGNVSVGTSAFAMIVLEHPLSKVYPEIDIVTTPVGEPVAMVHTNNCSSDINAWLNLFAEYGKLIKSEINKSEMFALLFKEALKADNDCGGLLSYGYLSGENITGLSQGRPLFVREQNSNFTLANFMRTHLYSAFGALRIGKEILQAEQIKVNHLVGHGGIFKTPEVGQRFLAAAMQSPVTVMETAGEGGAWGIALLAAYQKVSQKISLDEFLNQKVFDKVQGQTLQASPEELEGYSNFIARYKSGIEIEQNAVKNLR